jgi:hypothetical protein
LIVIYAIRIDLDHKSQQVKMATRVLVVEPATNQTVDDMMQSVEMEKTLEGRSVRVALGIVSAILGVYVIYRICLDNFRTRGLGYGRRQRCEKLNIHTTFLDC